MADSAPADRYPLSFGEVASGASLRKRATPIYPAALLAACPAPIQIQAVLIVDNKGGVGEVRVKDEAQADEPHRLLIASIRTVGLQWQFQPLTLSYVAADANGDSRVQRSETRPFSAAYAFRFECHAGKAEVSADQAAGP